MSDHTSPIPSDLPEHSQACPPSSEGPTPNDVVKWSAVGQGEEGDEDQGPAIAKLNGREFEYLVRKNRFYIGRNSSTRGEQLIVDQEIRNTSFQYSPS